MATLSPNKDKETAECVDHVSPSGATQKILSQVTGRGSFSRSQIAYNTKKVEGRLDLEQRSDADNLIANLKGMVNDKKMRYVALYHQVTTTTLLAVDKFQARRKEQQLLNEEDFQDIELEEAEEICLNYEGGIAVSPST
jgi:hypothetical protein